MRAIQAFQSTSARAKALITLYDGLLPSNRSIAMLDVADLLRSAVTLSVAGMDAYFTDRFAESLVPFLKKHGATSDLKDLLSRAGLNTQAALEMLTMQRPYRRIRALVEAYLSTYTTQKRKVIDELFLIYGIKGLCGNAEKYARKKKLLTSVDGAVLRRHAIVHAGDLNDYYRPRPITPRLAARYVGNVEIFVTHAEAILTNALKI